MSGLLEKAQWITANRFHLYNRAVSHSVVLFTRFFGVHGRVRRAMLHITAYGLYEAQLNDQPVADTLCSPGFTCYGKRLQVQSYDVTRLLRPDGENRLLVYTARGWALWEDPDALHHTVLAALEIEEEDGTVTELVTDSEWKVSSCDIVTSDLCRGETRDYRSHYSMLTKQPAEVRELPRQMLIAQEGLPIRRKEHYTVQRLLITPRGERVLDFGTALCGYVQVRVQGQPGDKLRLQYALSLDKNGNFDAEDTDAMPQTTYFLWDNTRRCAPMFALTEFRYVKLREYPLAEIDPACFTAVAVRSDAERTGWFRCGLKELNTLYEEVVGRQQRSMLDIPTTDCEQGWRFGRPEAVLRAAPGGMYTYQCLAFFRKWLRDVAAEQAADGSLPRRIPDIAQLPELPPSLESGLAVVELPWLCFRLYGDTAVLREQYPAMCRLEQWAAARVHGLREPFPQETADELPLYARLLRRLNRIASLLGYTADAERYLRRYERARAAVDRRLSAAQARHALPPELLPAALQSGAWDAGRVWEALPPELLSGKGLSRGLRTALEQLLFSWETEELYDLPVCAKRMGEVYPSLLQALYFADHDRAKDGGEADACAVAEWLYARVAGLRPAGENGGFSTVDICPLPHPQVGWAEAALKTGTGRIVSSWKYQKDTVCYTLEIPRGVRARFRVGDEIFELNEGVHRFRRQGSLPAEKC